MNDIAVLGLGHMGAAIAGRLAAAGYRVTAWNRSPRPPIPGVRHVDDLGSVDAGVVITMLTDGDAVEAVLAKLAPRAGTVVVDMSTIGPDAVRRIAAGLPAGVALVDAPVGGSTGAAAAGALRIFAGGADADVARVELVLAALGTVRRCGALGTGAAVKLVLNAALVTAVAGLADALTVAAAVGLDREAAVAVLRDGPLGFATERTLAPGAPAAHFRVALAAKDADLAIAAAGPDLPMLAAARTMMARAVPDDDLSALVRRP
ncbi:NAD(P)-dependent oxidoreductase [Dactylosporangium sp. CA-139066]|uniref:NAD(P)-dependent oxidoreductase n=1 Tax=Dactylosporangium sp. CA-139066 TaxID=3239930 RepID=UPI003D908FA3